MTSQHDSRPAHPAAPRPRAGNKEDEATHYGAAPLVDADATNYPPVPPAPADTGGTRYPGQPADPGRTNYDNPPPSDEGKATRQAAGAADPHVTRYTPPGAESDSLSDGRPPRRCGGYELLGELGQGGMGVVFRARQTALKRLVAVKMIRPRPTSAGRRAFKWARRHPVLATGLGVTALAVLAVTLLVGYGISERAAGRREQEKTRYELDTRQGQLEAEGAYATFLRQRDEALFHAVAGTEFAGMDPPASLAAARDAAGQALAAIPFDEDGRVVPSPHWKVQERAEVHDGCYELLLVLAGALLGPPGKQPGPTPAEVAEAGRYLDRAARLGPPTWAYHVCRARHLEALGQPAEACAECERARARRPATAADFFLQGDAFYREGDWAKARHAFDQALHRRPDHFWAQYYVALCDLSRNETLAAEEGLTAYLARRPEFVWTYLVRGGANIRLKEFEDAERDFRAATRLQRNADAEYALYANRGALFLEEGKYGQARADLDRARELKPERYQAYLNLALLARRRRDDPAALTLLEQALARNSPPAERALINSHRADILLRQGRIPGAAAACDAALRLRPGDTPTLAILATARLKAEQYAEAEQASTEYLRKGGRPDPDIYRGRGQARVQLGRYADTVQDYTSGLADRPDAELLNHRGWAYVFREAWKPARDDFAEALQLDPNEKEALVGHSLCRAMLGDYRTAAAEAEAAWRPRPGRVETMHNLACAFAQVTGRAAAQDAALAAHARARAVEALRAGLRLVPHDNRAAYWRERMSPDQALDPIRDSAEFRCLAREYAGDSAAN
jgi:tetratricopeptide (TPR) repeat protein